MLPTHWHKEDKKGGVVAKRRNLQNSSLFDNYLRTFRLAWRHKRLEIWLTAGAEFPFCVNILLFHAVLDEYHLPADVSVIIAMLGRHERVSLH